MTPMLYVSRPVTVEAVRVTPENRDEVATWCGGTVAFMAPDGDWVVHRSGFSVLTDLEFQAAYNSLLREH